MANKPKPADPKPQKGQPTELPHLKIESLYLRKGLIPGAAFK